MLEIWEVKFNAGDPIWVVAETLEKAIECVNSDIEYDNDYNIISVTRVKKGNIFVYDK